MTSRAQTEYASSGDLSIAYQVFGEGPVDVVFVPGFMSHVELNWDYVFMSTGLERLAQFLAAGRVRQARLGSVGSLARRGHARRCG